MKERIYQSLAAWQVVQGSRRTPTSLTTKPLWTSWKPLNKHSRLTCQTMPFTSSCSVPSASLSLSCSSSSPSCSSRRLWPPLQRPHRANSDTPSFGPQPSSNLSPDSLSSFNRFLLQYPRKTKLILLLLGMAFRDVWQRRNLQVRKLFFLCEVFILPLIGNEVQMQSHRRIWFGDLYCELHFWEGQVESGFDHLILFEWGIIQIFFFFLLSWYIRYWTLEAPTREWRWRSRARWYLRSVLFYSL